ncbi:MAG: sensor histidine kinase [Candidatus Thorarchaeota archaeon]
MPDDDQYEESDERLLTLRRIAHQVVCLRNVSRLLSDITVAPATVYYKLVHMIPEGFQYPEVACARLVLGSSEYHTVDFKETPWRLHSEVKAPGLPPGVIEICYLEEMPPAEEGPFLAEEQQFLDTVAMEVSGYRVRRRMQTLRDQQLRELDLYSSLLRHDLRNDVGVVVGNIDLLRMMLPEADDAVVEALDSIEGVCDRMTSLLTALGTESREPETQILKILQRAMETSEKASPDMKVRLEFDGELEEVLVPESRLLPLVFDNLLRNAAVHAGPNPEVKIHVRAEPSKVRITVSDNGPGVDDSVKDLLFHKGVSTRGGGLGLYLSREVLKTIGGTIELVESEPGAGATFAIEIPVM